MEHEENSKSSLYEAATVKWVRQQLMALRGKDVTGESTTS